MAEARRLHHDLLISTTMDHKMADQLDDLRLHIDRMSEFIRVQITYMKSPNLRSGRKTSADERIKINHYYALLAR